MHGAAVELLEHAPELQIAKDAAIGIEHRHRGKRAILDVQIVVAREQDAEGVIQRPGARFLGPTAPQELNQSGLSLGETAETADLRQTGVRIDRTARTCVAEVTEL